MIDRRAVLIGLAGAIPALDAAAKSKHKPKHKKSKPHKQGHPVHHHKGHGHVNAQGFANPNDGPLISRYGGNASNGVDQYRPRAFGAGFVARDIQRDTQSVAATWKVTDHGGYNNWDAFPFGGVGGGMTKEVSGQWASFDAGRAVTVGYVWRDASAFPLTGWTQSGTVKAAIQDSRGWTGNWPVYRKTFNAGTVNIPSPSHDGNVKILPWLLFAEGDGTPSPAPSVPNGRNLPTPNDTCPDWVHDQYKVGGFATWQPPIDPKYWCYFRHEHGSDPRWVYPANDGGPRYNEIALVMGKNEKHEGFKNYAIQTASGHWLLLVHHFGTTGVGRANTCTAQMHTLEFHLRSPDKRTTLAVVRYMADFGRSLGMFSQDIGGDPINPTACPNGNNDTGLTTRNPSRQIPLSPFGLHDNGYEPWITVLPTFLGFSGKLVFNTTDAIDICPDNTCDTPVRTDKGTGTGRFVTFDDQVGLKDMGYGNAQGYFYTDVFGTKVLQATDPGAVRQMVVPGLNWQASLTDLPDHGHMGGAAVARWGDPCITVPTGVPGDAEGSIFATRGPN